MKEYTTKDNSFFVYYDDGEGEGFVGFKTADEALNFIEKRMQLLPHASSLENYTLIFGEEQTIGIVKIIERLEIMGDSAL